MSLRLPSRSLQLGREAHMRDPGHGIPGTPLAGAKAGHEIDLVRGRRGDNHPRQVEPGEERHVGPQAANLLGLPEHAQIVLGSQDLVGCRPRHGRATAAPPGAAALSAGISKVSAAPLAPAGPASRRLTINSASALRKRTRAADGSRRSNTRWPAASVA